jgi:hypothetical protein
MKQETFEESVAKKLYPLNDGFQVMDIDISEELQVSFINGYKLAQERSYSEEEVLDILKELEIECVINPRRTEIREWFNKFKKK